MNIFSKAEISYIDINISWTSWALGILLIRMKYSGGHNIKIYLSFSISISVYAYIKKIWKSDDDNRDDAGLNICYNCYINQTQAYNAKLFVKMINTKKMSLKWPNLKQN